MLLKITTLFGLILYKLSGSMLLEIINSKQLRILSSYENTKVIIQ